MPSLFLRGWSIYSQGSEHGRTAAQHHLLNSMRIARDHLLSASAIAEFLSRREMWRCLKSRHLHFSLQPRRAASHTEQEDKIHLLQ
ncbi:hypothetical protein VTN02DRAFT_2698 [Thermoascus thermophilus]